MRIIWDERNRLWGGGSHLAGGAPWRLLRLSARARPVVERLRAAGPAGIDPTTPLEVAVTRWLVGRGLAHPRPTPRSDHRPDHRTEDRPGDGAGDRRDERADDGRDDVVVIIPAYGRPELLEACLASLGPTPTIVVDDASPDPGPIRAVCDAHGATYLRHTVNRGPGAARNTGLAQTTAPLVAFLDSDCTVPDDWLRRLVPHLDDDRVGLVAPRVRPRPAADSVIARHEQTRSALDMGARPELVTHGARLGFLPSAALVVRRSAIPAAGFDPAMRVGEDVDLVWRLIDAGWLARYEPAVSVRHEMRLEPAAWVGRRFDYGTSAAALDRRHPGRLTPARLASWNVAAIATVLAGRPLVGVTIAAGAAADLASVLDTPGHRAELAIRVTAKAALADAVGLGHALRREWWPLGWAGLACAPRTRWGRLAALAMLAPIVVEYVRDRPDLDPVRHVALRLLEDAAHGSGVLTGALAQRSGRILRPHVRPPERMRVRRLARATRSGDGVGR